MDSRWKLGQFLISDVWAYMANNNGQTQTSPTCTITTHLPTSQLLLLIYEPLASGKIAPYNMDRPELLQKMIILSIDYTRAEDFCTCRTVKKPNPSMPREKSFSIWSSINICRSNFLKSPFKIIYIWEKFLMARWLIWAMLNRIIYVVSNILKFLSVLTFSCWPAYWLSGRVWPGRLGFNLRSSHTKDSKMVLDTSLLNTQFYMVRIMGKVEESRESSSALPNTSVY